MPLLIVRDDITRMRVDAIVNAANASLLGGGGVDGSIHRAAGLELLAECRTLGGCETGRAKLTGAYRLPCRYIIHTVGPVWQGGAHGEAAALASCYRASLELAERHGCQSVAFPLISAGAYGYPRPDALQIATETIGTYLETRDMDVYLVVFDKGSYQIATALYNDVRRYIDDTYVAEKRRSLFSRMLRSERPARPLADRTDLPSAADTQAPDDTPELCSYDMSAAPEETSSLRHMLGEIDESFAEMLLRKIDERGMTDVECYKRANVDRKLFSKIRGNPLYQPSKPTALAFAIALRMPLDETRELLMKAGFALSHSSKFDVIVEYCIRKGMWNVHQVNELLFEFDQALLGMM